MNEKIDSVTRWFFWAGFVVFLSASIPHIATYFRHFDPDATGWEDTFYWSISYLLAIVIDTTDMLVSIAMVRALSNGARHRQLLPYWGFISFIMILSWFINWQYDIVHSTDAFRAADSISIFAGLTTVGKINPIIGSAFQFLILIYTGMAHKFNKKIQVKTAAEWANELSEMQSINGTKQQISKLKREQRKEQIAGGFNLFSNVIRSAKSEFSQAFSNDIQNEENEFSPVVSPSDSHDIQTEEIPVIFEENVPVSPVFSESERDHFDEEKRERKSEFFLSETDRFDEEKEDISPLFSLYPKLLPIASRSGKTVTLEEIEKATGISERILLNRVRNKQLNRTGRNEKIVFKDSVFSWLKEERMEDISGKKMRSIPRLKVVGEE